MSAALPPIPEFSLFGGPLHQAGVRLKVVRGNNTVWLGALIGVSTWAVWMVLALAEGAGKDVSSLSVVGVHVRLLVAVPLFYLCESRAGPRMAEFVRDLVTSGIVPQAARSALAAAIHRVDRLKDPWVAELVFAALAFGAPFIEMAAGLPGPAAQSAPRSPSNAWFTWVCLPLFRFIVLRWIWHLLLWSYFLWQVQRLSLHLVPTHPDRAAGLGYLEVVHEAFGTLAIALSATCAAAFAENVASGRMTFELIYLVAPLVLLVIAALILGPLAVFSPSLLACREHGWREYMAMATRYVDAFDRKWLREGGATGESQLGTGDLQSLADLNNSVTVIREMRLVPASRRLVLILVASVIVPMVPLLLLKYSVGDLLAQLFRTISGL